MQQGAASKWMEERIGPLCSQKWWSLFCKGQPGTWRHRRTLSLRVWPAPTGPQRPPLGGRQHSFSLSQTSGGCRTCADVIPSSKYCTVESLETLGSKLAMSGAMYCVVVSMWWVMSPMKMNPGRSRDQTEEDATVSNNLQNSSRRMLVESVQHSLRGQKSYLPLLW